jgi:hypothetical protein
LKALRGEAVMASAMIKELKSLDEASGNSCLSLAKSAKKRWLEIESRRETKYANQFLS